MPLLKNTLAVLFNNTGESIATVYEGVDDQRLRMVRKFFPEQRDKSLN